MLQGTQSEKLVRSKTDMEHQCRQAKEVFDEFLKQLNHLVLDKHQQTKLALSCLLAGGHLLLQDLPGMGKTTMAESLARLSGLTYRRVQFTSDMLPSDILGISIFNPEKQDFEFREGPVFTQVLLADEINRTSPKTQSALLEAMEENQV
jgi:MoxR-like ATPase